MGHRSGTWGQQGEPGPRPSLGLGGWPREDPEALTPGTTGPCRVWAVAVECQAWATDWMEWGPELALSSSLGRHFLPSQGLPGEFRGPSS